MSLRPRARSAGYFFAFISIFRGTQSFRHERYLRAHERSNHPMYR